MRPDQARWRVVLLGAIVGAVAIAFADSSIVVLALPQLYATFDTSIEGIAWVITSYNLVLAVVAFALVPVVHRVGANVLLGLGSILFLGASIACALADSLTALVVARSVQGMGGAILLAGSLPVLGTLSGSTLRGIAIWTTAGTFGAALGPALGGTLAQVFDWRAIFLAQAPIAGAALLAARVRVSMSSRDRTASWFGRTLPANLALTLVSGALVGALFLGVLLLVDVFSYRPIAGAAILSLLPGAALLARPLARNLSIEIAAGGGAALLVAGLAGLALLPSSALGAVLASFALCGAGLGLAVPGLTHAALDAEGDVDRRATLTVGLRHLGLVISLAVVAPVLAADLRAAADVATLNGVAVVIDGQIPATTKIPLALDIRDALERAPEGEMPDLTGPFEEHGADADAAVARVRNDLEATIEQAVTRGFRRSFLFAGLLAALALVPILFIRRRLPT